MDKKKKTCLRFLPTELRKSLMKFQKDGIRYGINKNGRCLIGDEMGLGKTLQAIGIAYFFKSKWPLLIIVPSSMRYGWVNELEKWLPCIQPGDINVVSSCACLGSMMNSQISIISYGLLSQPRRKGKSVSEVIGISNFGVVIIDESHYIKRMQSIRTKEVIKSAKKISHKILLSGTPTLARPIELFPQIHLIQPQLLGSYHTFGEKFCAGHYVTEKARGGQFYQKYDMSGASNLGDLHELLVKNVMIRRLKEQVLTQLPAKRRQKIMFEIGQNSKHKKELEGLFENLKKMLHPQQNELEGMISSSYKLEFMRLFNSTAVAKAAAIQQYISDMLDGMENKFIVFCFHLTMIKAVQQLLIKRKIKHICITGEVSSLQRGLDAEVFQTDPDCRVAVLSIQAASTGLTLTAADHVIFSELHYTPGVLLQAEDRCHRIGQKNSVLVHYLVAMGTIDEFLWSCLKRKILVTSATLNGKISDLHVDAEDFGKKDLLSGLEAWQPVSTVVPNEIVENLFQKKVDHKDIRVLLSTSPRKKNKRKFPRKTCEPIVVWSDEEEENEFKPCKKKQKNCFASKINNNNISDEVEKVKPFDHSSQIMSRKDSNISSTIVCHSEDNACSSVGYNTEFSPPKFKDCVNVDIGALKEVSVVSCNQNAANVQKCGGDELSRSIYDVDCLHRKDSHQIMTETHECSFDRINAHTKKTMRDSKYGKGDASSLAIDPCKTDVNVCVHKDNASDIILIDSHSDFKNHFSYTKRDEEASKETCDTSANNIAVNFIDSSTDHIVDKNANPAGDWVCLSCLYLNCSLETCQKCKINRTINSRTVEIASSPELFDDREEVDVIDVYSSNDEEEEDIQSSGILLFESDSDTSTAHGSGTRHNKSVNSSYNSEVFLDDDAEFDAILSQVDDTELKQHTKSEKSGKAHASSNIECIVLDEHVASEVNKALSVSLTPDKSVSISPISEDKSGEPNTYQESLLDFFDGSNDSLDQNMLNLNTDEVCCGQPNDTFSSSDDEDDELCENDLVLRKIDFRYCMSRYTQRVFLYDKEDNFLEMKFSVQDIDMSMFEHLPPLLSYDQNLKQLQHFNLLWKQMGPVKQNLVKKSGRTFVDPLVFYKQLYDEKYGSKKNNYKRYITKDDQLEKAKQAAHTAGGKVIKLSPRVSKSNAKTKARTNPSRDDVKQAQSSSEVYQAVDSENCPLCLYCSSRIEGMQSGSWGARYCSQKCMEEHKIRSKGRFYGPRDLLFDMEQGICQICGINAHEIFREVSLAHANKRKEILEATPYCDLPIPTLNRMITMPTPGLFWEADHMKAVAEGGGQCGLENYRTLCTPCHRDVTRRLKMRMSRNKKKVKCMNLKEFFGSQTSPNCKSSTK